VTATGTLTASATAGSSSGPIRLLVDPADTVDCVRALTARHSVPDGIAVCHPMPGADSRTVLAGEVLVALGKRPGGLAAEGLLRRGWALAGLWLRAEGIRHLVVLRAHLLPAEQWRDLTELAAAADAVLWLVSHRVGLDPSHRPVLAEHGVTARGQPWRDALAALTPAPGESTEMPDARPFPAVPDVDFPTFRGATHRLLDPDAFARVDAVNRAVLTAARSEAHTLQVLARRTDADPRPAVEATIQRMTVSAVSEAEVLTRLRAAQAGFFLEGTLLRVRLYRHRGQSGFSLRPRLPAPVVARLRTLCAPAAAGALAIRVATGFSVDVLVRLRVGDVIDRGEDIDISASGGLWRIPAPVAAIVRAAVADHPATTSLGGWPPAPPSRVHPRRRADARADDAAAAQVSGSASRCRRRRPRGRGRHGGL
jgi:hypothetical protein